MTTTEIQEMFDAHANETVNTKKRRRPSKRDWAFGAATAVAMIVIARVTENYYLNKYDDFGNLR